MRFSLVAFKVSISTMPRAGAARLRAAPHLGRRGRPPGGPHPQGRRRYQRCLRHEQALKAKKHTAASTMSANTPRKMTGFGSLIPGTYTVEGGSTPEALVRAIMAGPATVGDTLAVPEDIVKGQPLARRITVGEVAEDGGGLGAELVEHHAHHGLGVRVLGLTKR